MTRLRRAWKRGVDAFIAASESHRYEAAGTPIVCQHCGNDTFEQDKAMLNRRLRTFLQLDWTDKQGTALVCNRCGLIHWFLKQPERV